MGAEEAKRLIEREGYKILDVRSAREYDNKHITKPARCSISAPVVMNDNVTPNERFLAEVSLHLERFVEPITQAHRFCQPNQSPCVCV